MTNIDNKPLSAKDVLLTSRPIWWLMTTLLFAIGFLTHDFRVSGMLLIGAFYFLFPYNLLVYGLNDIADYELDKRNPHKTSVLGKSKHVSLAIVILATNLPYWFYFIHTGTRLSDIWLFLTIFMAAAYSLKGIRFKEIPVADSLTAAFVASAPFMFGVIWVSGQIGWLLAFVMLFLWAFASHALSTVRDLVPTAKAGSESIATKLGSSKTVIVALLGYSLAALITTVIFGGPGLVVSLLLLSYVWLAARALPYRRRSTNAIFQRSYRIFIYLNYTNGLLIGLYLLLLHKLTH